MAAPPSARAADDIEEVATTTYRVDPDGGRVRVTVVLSVTNHVPDTVSYVSCTRWEFDPYLGWYTVPDLCPQTTRYYVNGTYVWVDAGAQNLKITADRGSVKRAVSTRGTQIVTYRLTFSPIYRNQTRKLTISYDIVGGAPRSAAFTRVGRAYLSFCATAHGASTELDAETIKIVVPAGFDLSVRPTPMATSSGDGSLVLTASLDGSEAASFYRCLDGTNEAAFRRASLATASGLRIQVLSWPEDGDWHAAVTGAAPDLLDALVRLIGRPPSASEIVIQETASGVLGEYAGFYTSETSTAFVSEDYRQARLIAHELAHAWFDDRIFAARWMWEGLAEWAAVEAGTPSQACLVPPYPGFGILDLDEWPILGPRSSERDEELVQLLYEEACTLFETIDDRVGPARMRAVFETLFSRGPAYEGAAAKKDPGQPADWRYLLDVLDERALVPAGVSDLELAEKLFVSYGVASPEDLAGRAAARAAYHRLLADLDPWPMPAIVPSALEAWDFAAVQPLVQSLSAALVDVRTAESLVPELDAMHGPVRAAVAGATSQADLVQAAALAARQRRAAEVVVAAREAIGRPRDLLEEIGLLGTDVAALDDPILGAASRADLAAAEAQYRAVENLLGEARGQGAIRLAVAGSPVVAFLGLGVWVVRRRRRAARANGGATGVMAVEALGSGAPAPGVEALSAARDEPSGELERLREDAAQLSADAEVKARPYIGLQPADGERSDGSTTAHPNHPEAPGDGVPGGVA